MKRTEDVDVIRITDELQNAMNEARLRYPGRIPEDVPVEFIWSSLRDREPGTPLVVVRDNDGRYEYAIAPIQ
jgi:hypothetical protein